MARVDDLDARSKNNTQSISQLEAQVSANPKMLFKKRGTDMWLRTPYDGTYDLIQKISSAYTDNGILEPLTTTVISKSTAKDFATSWDGGTLWHNVIDDAAPFKYNGTYIGGGHGAYLAQNIAVSSHDKTNADLGSKWIDAGSKQWTLVKIIDTTHLLLIPDIGSHASGYWTFDATLGASPLTHVSGATHAGNISFTSSAIASLAPIVKNLTLQTLVDGKIDVSTTSIDSVPDDVYQCDFVEFKQTYDIYDPRTLQAYMWANVGKTITEAAANASVTSEMTLSITYRFRADNSCDVYVDFTNHAPLNAFYFGGVQSGSLRYADASRKLLEYIPRSKSWVGGVATWDFTVPTEIQTTFESIKFPTSHWANTSKPPFRFTQILKDSSGNPLIGFTLGYSLLKSKSVDATRYNNLDATDGAATMQGSSRKSYPVLMASALLADETNWNGYCYRTYFNPNDIGDATVYQWHREGDALIVDIDFHETVTNQRLQLPYGLIGKTVTLLDSNGTITVHTTTVTDGYLTVSATTYGSATVKIA